VINFQFLSKKIHFVEEDNKWSAFEKDAVQYFSKQFFTLPHPVGGVVLVQDLVVVTQGDDEQNFKKS
jgi:hypothetical protein